MEQEELNHIHIHNGNVGSFSVLTTLSITDKHSKWDLVSSAYHFSAFGYLKVLKTSCIG